MSVEETLEDLESALAEPIPQTTKQILRQKQEHIHNLWLGKEGLEKNIGRAKSVITKIIMDNENIITVGTIKGRFSIYVYGGGIYEDRGLIYLEKLIDDVLGEMTSNTNVNEIMGIITRQTKKTMKIFNEKMELICLKNGILNIITKEFIPHTPKHYFLHKLPINYDKNAKCPNFVKFLYGILPNNWQRKDRLTILEFTGYCFYRAYPINQFLILNGFGSNGKTTYLNLLNELFGIENIATIKLHKMNNDFKLFPLYQKYVNHSGEVGEMKISTLEMIKDITGNDVVTIEQKFKDSFNTTLFCKMVFANNKMPQIKEDDDAIYRRIIIIEFTEKFEAGKETTDMNMLKKITTEEEKSGILNLVIKHLHNLLANEKFSAFLGIEENRKKLQVKLNPIKEWIEKECIFDSVFETLSSELHRDFNRFAKDYGVAGRSQIRFNEELLSVVGAKINKKKTNKGIAFVGVKIKIRDPEDHEKPKKAFDKFMTEED